MGKLRRVPVGGGIFWVGGGGLRLVGVVTRFSITRFKLCLIHCNSTEEI